MAVKIAATRTSRSIRGRLSFISAHNVYALAQIKPRSFKQRRKSFYFILPGVDTPNVYVGASTLYCLRSLSSKSKHGS